MVVVVIVPDKLELVIIGRTVTSVLMVVSIESAVVYNSTTEASVVSKIVRSLSVNKYGCTLVTVVDVVSVVIVADELELGMSELKVRLSAIVVSITSAVVTDFIKEASVISKIEKSKSVDKSGCSVVIIVVPL